MGPASGQKLQVPAYMIGPMPRLPSLSSCLFPFLLFAPLTEGPKKRRTWALRSLSAPQALFCSLYPRKSMLVPV